MRTFKANLMVELVVSVPPRYKLSTVEIRFSWLNSVRMSFSLVTTDQLKVYYCFHFRIFCSTNLQAFGEKTVDVISGGVCIKRVLVLLNLFGDKLS